MTKKLSEIGRQMYGTNSFVESPDSSEYFGALFSWEKGDDTYLHSVVVLTPAERRELVTQAIQSWESRKWHTTLKTGSSIEIDEFLEEQGL